MNENWNTTFISPENLVKLARGNPAVVIKYLRQFQELIPQRIENLKVQLQEQERKKVRQTLHQMSPQLQFFCVPDVLPLITRLELEYETIPMDELTTMTNDILANLEGARKEVEMVLNTHFA